MAEFFDKVLPVRPRGADELERVVWATLQTLPGMGVSLRDSSGHLIRVRMEDVAPRVRELLEDVGA